MYKVEKRIALGGLGNILIVYVLMITDLQF